MDINYISNEDFFISLNEGVIVLGLKKLLDGVHFTLSFSPNSDDINLHITRHVDDEINKPKIVIAVANKKVLENELLTFSKGIFQLVLEPLYFEKPRKLPKTGYHPFCKYFSLNKLEKGQLGEQFNNEVRTVFKRSSKFKGLRKLILRPELIANFTAWTKSSHTKTRIKEEFLCKSQVSVEHVEQGYLHSSNYSGMVIIVGSQIFKIRDDISIVDLANAFLGNELTKLLVTKTNTAIKDIFQAADYNQSIPFNDPVRIFA
ncbi:MAG: hypothetical protein M3O71_10285 [Bacteroidota bacterium]|nr:hypothetical protein [Bacteroidota bacterium]